MNWKSLLSARRPGIASSSGGSYRSAFEQDYDRIIFSHPFRRLQDKTQVHPLPEHDFVHTRLTHSLEVSSVGRSLGKKVGEVLLERHPELTPGFSLFDFGAIVAAAALAHDLGNPPFGHAGEDALSDFFRDHPTSPSISPACKADLIQFEGNAQGFRILNQGEYGLKLTAATLGAFTKYPCPSHLPGRDKSKKSQKKYGFFQSESAIFRELAQELELQPGVEGSWSRHPLAFLVEAADDICYSIIDLEDGCRLGLVSFDETVALLAPILGEKLDRSKLAREGGLNQKLGSLRALAIGALIEDCTRVFLDHESDMLNGTFDKALVDLGQYKSAVDHISSVSVEKIYRARQVVEIEASGHEVLPGLLAEFVAAASAIGKGGETRKNKNLSLLFPVETKLQLQETGDDYQRLRLVIDFISGLTDRHALSLYRKIKGISF
ncbi:MAG: deoxyguanosinetriphosphate triphosphohydrolase [Cyclobacteriaceae bacterium]